MNKIRGSIHSWLKHFCFHRRKKRIGTQSASLFSSLRRFCSTQNLQNFFWVAVAPLVVSILFLSLLPHGLSRQIWPNILNWKPKRENFNQIYNFVHRLPEVRSSMKDRFTVCQTNITTIKESFNIVFLPFKFNNLYFKHLLESPWHMQIGCQWICKLFNENLAKQRNRAYIFFSLCTDERVWEWAEKPHCVSVCRCLSKL